MREFPDGDSKTDMYVQCQEFIYAIQYQIYAILSNEKDCPNFVSCFLQNRKKNLNHLNHSIAK